jgi:hypothetical protein
MTTLIVRPVDLCGYVGDYDGLCAHPANTAPECHCAACPLVKVEPCGRGCAACPPKEAQS